LIFENIALSLRRADLLAMKPSFDRGDREISAFAPAVRAGRWALRILEAKMAVNRDREWKSSDDGNGYHVRHKSAATKFAE
jgi:hypothetical protein